MQRNIPRAIPLNRTLTAAVLAICLNASLIGALLHQPTRGESLLFARNPVAMPMVVGSVTVATLKAGFEATFTHAGRDLRHAGRDVLRSLNHQARTIGAVLSWSGNPADTAPTC